MPAARSRSVAARSLADDVRARTDEQLQELVRRRPDLARPAPADLTSLAARASTRASTQRALDGLDRGHLQVLEALVLSGDPVDVPAAARLLCQPVGAVRSAVDTLWRLGLTWRGADGVHVTRTVSEVLGPYPAGLGPGVADLRGAVPAAYASDAALDDLIASAPADARALLERLAWGPPVGVLTADGPLATAGRWLLTHHLLYPQAADHVVLPREAALRLRGGRVHRQVTIDPPALDLTPHDPGSVDAVAGGQAGDLVALLDELASEWGPRPPRVLRAGGLAVRDLRRLASRLDLAPDRAAFVVEVAYSAGLVADDGSLEPVWAPTPGYDEWQQLPSADRWSRLATAWLASPRAAHLVGSAPEGGSGTVNALSADVLWPPVRALRADVLRELAELPAGAAAGRDSLEQRIRWRRPLRTPRNVDQVVAAVLQEAEWLGITGRGALSTAGRLLLGDGDGGDAAAATRAMDQHLPAAVEHVLLQADLTAVAPGRLDGGLARLMRLVADVESRGGATVFRFSPESVRRGLDAGWTAAQVLKALQDASATPVPQPLEYLVGDVARRHGQTRIGAVSAYVRSDDEAVLDAMLADRGLSPLQLRRIAPTVSVSPAPATTVLEMLRENGFAPVAESAEGAVVVPPASHHRTPSRRPPATAMLTSVVDDEASRALVASLRAGEDAATYAREHEQSLPGPRLPATDPTVTLAVLREAAAERHGVWIGHADADGRATRILFFPRRIEGGRAYGPVEGSNIERSFSIHRITGAATA